MDVNKTLELTGVTDYEAVVIKQGYEKFINGKGCRYFGSILNKRELRDINRAFNYLDIHSWVSGAIIGAAAVGLYEVYKRAKNKNAVQESESYLRT